jgi:murein DD-endopeptidase MepM/ murein hydrolase activator NlpD
MRNTYRYNPATCRYEPEPLKAKDILIPLTIFLAVGSLLFIGLLVLHSAWIVTERSQELARDNRVLEYHHQNLSNELTSVKASIASLYAADKTVQQKLVADHTPVSVLKALDIPYPSRGNQSLEKLLRKASSKTETLLGKAHFSNYYFGQSLSIAGNEVLLLMSLPSRQPVENEELTKLASGYGLRTNPYHKGEYLHRGIDFAAPRGTPVQATASGRVTEATKSDLPMGEGNVVEIDHGNGYKTRYTHLGDIHVKPGQNVSKGSTIATVGMSGGSIAPHLHYEVLKNNMHVDPLGYFMDGISSTDFTALSLLANQKNQSLD